MAAEPYRDPEFVTNGTRRKLTGYKTDLVADGALEFLDTVKDRPFYLLVPFYAPHTPYDYQPEPYRAPYRDAAFPCFPDGPMHPWQNPQLASHHGNRASKLAYSALITGMDHNLGRVVRRLEELKLRDNTLIVFTADQGWNAGHHGIWGKGNGTIPFNMYEESLRVPLIWNHPARIRRGQVFDPLVSSYDYLPTILEYLGLPPHRDAKLPGRSYASKLTGQALDAHKRLYFEYAYVRGLRTREPEVHRAHEGVAQRALRSGSRPGREAERDRRSGVREDAGRPARGACVLFPRGGGAAYRRMALHHAPAHAHVSEAETSDRRPRPTLRRQPASRSSRSSGCRGGRRARFAGVRMRSRAWSSRARWSSGWPRVTSQSTA